MTPDLEARVAQLERRSKLAEKARDRLEMKVHALAGTITEVARSYQIGVRSLDWPVSRGPDAPAEPEKPDGGPD